MKLRAILKSISIRNNDVDSYLKITLEVNNEGINLTALNELKHKDLEVELKES